MQKITAALNLFRESLAFGALCQLDLGNAISMAPLLQDKDILIVRKTSIHDVERSSIIVYHLTSIFIAHRCMRIDRRDGQPIVLMTKGDSVNFIDPYTITEKELLGTVAGIIRNNITINCETPNWRNLNRVLWLLSTANIVTNKLKNKISAKFKNQILTRCLRTPLVLFDILNKKAKHFVVMLWPLK